jgi:hypothetical protein
MMKRILACLSLCLIAASSFALEAKDGLMKIVLPEGSGRFNLYYLQDVSKSAYVPLLFERDPRTSSLNLLVDNKMYRLGESPEFRISAQKTDAGAEYTFKSSFLQIRQTFTFTKSAEAGLVDGVKMTIKAENLTDRDMSIGIRLILDSYLGEKGGTHFLTDLRQRIASETILTESAKDSWIVSPSSDNGKTGLKVALKAGTQPDSVILANWSRINSSPWVFDFNQTRNFTLQPYSINDSAIAMDYDPKVTPRSKSRDVTVYLSSRDSSLGDAATVVTPPATNADFGSSIAATASGEGKNTSIQADLLAVRDLLDKINQKLAAGQALSPGEKKTYSDIVQQLKSRKAAY